MKKKCVSGIVQNISTNPFATFSRRNSRNLKVFSFDISFDLVDNSGKVRHVWFKRSFRFPPKLEDGDYIEIVGRRGYLIGLLGKKNFYAMRIIDRKRNREYTPWRNILTRSLQEKNSQVTD
ncbi:MAG: hypothetical protein CVT63_07050 [Candidatus Anoxymicrobium japonicum]|uniref:Uncharacterized protein n=1 Tax=Candidatus Anoxymicrobium japonicum TaxID=2013648 RepID=A0A2N3G4H4_9ACTN|nr:MAG: hypothetical protein CVT63_07050 [Candidatus Anoxymicrobium japonicum]